MQKYVPMRYNELVHLSHSRLKYYVITVNNRKAFLKCAEVIQQLSSHIPHSIKHKQNIPNELPEQLINSCNKIIFHHIECISANIPLAPSLTGSRSCCISYLQLLCANYLPCISTYGLSKKQLEKLQNIL